MKNTWLECRLKNLDFTYIHHHTYMNNLFIASAPQLILPLSQFRKWPECPGRKSNSIVHLWYFLPLSIPIERIKFVFFILLNSYGLCPDNRSLKTIQTCTYHLRILLDLFVVTLNLNLNSFMESDLMLLFGFFFLFFPPIDQSKSLKRKWKNF